MNERSDGQPAFALSALFWSVLGLVLAGAVYLYAMRGSALLLDLANGMAGVLCL
jgi:hypothetical protein